MANRFTTAAEFHAFQQKRRQELWDLLGDLPAPRKPEARLVRTEQKDGYRLEHLELELNGIEPVPALLLIPDKLAAPAPGLLYIHSHGGHYSVGKEELVQGLDVLRPLAPVCAEKGIVALAIDSWCFSGRKREPDGGQGEQNAFKLMLWRGQVLWGMMLFDEFQAVSYLTARPEVDAKRIGAFGMSMGATKAWWLAALDPRVALCIDICCLTDFDALIHAKNLQGHGIYYYVPKLLKHFSTSGICELIVPRRHLSVNGRRDLLTPPEGVTRVGEHLASLYRQFGRADDCRVELFDCAHEETPAMRRLTMDWLDRGLVRPQ
jgi:hypothetical protein